MEKIAKVIFLPIFLSFIITHINARETIVNEKIIKLKYVDDIHKGNGISNIVIFLSYYDEENLKEVTLNDTTDENGLVSFSIPETKDRGSSIFKFDLTLKKLKNKSAYRIPPLYKYNEGGQKSILILFEKKWLTNKEAPLELIWFPSNGEKIGRGGDICLKNSVLSNK